MKKHVRTILTVLLSICILLSCISVGFAAAPANENQQASREAFRVEIDSETKGHWQGKYGNDAVILFGYNYTGTLNENSNETDFIEISTYDYIAKAEDSVFQSLNYNIGGHLWCHRQNDDTILDKPGNAQCSEKFFAGALSGPINTPHRLTHKAEFHFAMADEGYHLITIYGCTDSYGPFYVIFEKDGKEILVDEFTADTFIGGKYISYLVPGNVTMYMDKQSMVAGITGIFIDKAPESMATNLNVAAGTEPRSAKLTWQETSLDSTAIIAIDRKAADGTWETIQTIQAGIKEYVDSDLQAGTTYSYRLRVISGTTYSQPCAEASYEVPVYALTTLTLDQTLYHVSDSGKTVVAKATLKNENDQPLAGESIQLSAAFAHGTQQIGAVVTDDTGIAQFSFQPAYLGQATLTARFADNDEKHLTNSSATAELFVGETGWDYAPVIYKISDAVLPGDLVNINGYGFRNKDMTKLAVKYAPHTTDTVSAEPPAAAKDMEIVQTDARDGFYLVTELPADAAAGLYDIWVTNGIGYTEPVTLNAARPLFISEYEAWAGQAIEISGRNLLAGQFGADAATKVRLGTTEQKILKNTPYSITFKVQAPLGTYNVEVSNDNGVTWRGLVTDQTLTVVAKGSDPLNIGVAWMNDFAWDNVFDVTAYGANGADAEDDTPAVKAAIEAARASEKQGGIIYFPNGSYYVGALKLPANLVFLGESTDNTILYYNGTGGNMFESDGDGQTIGHQGFANFSIRLSDDNTRPDAFFWLGHAWGDAFNHNTLRKASEFFISSVDLNYTMNPLEKNKTAGNGQQRALGAVLIADRRFIVKDSNFIGEMAGLTHIYMNEYSSYRNVMCDFESGNLQSVANYNFIEDCHVTGGLRKAQDLDNHGIFARAFCHIENNHVEQVGNFNQNDGETYCVEVPGGNFDCGEILNAAKSSITVLSKKGGLQEAYAVMYDRLVVRITAGRGLGQQEEVESIDPATGTITIKGEWEVIPDHTSKASLLSPQEYVTIYNNTASDSAKGIYLFGNLFDAVAVNNVSVDTEGIFIWSAAYDSIDVQDSFVTIRENKVIGVSPKSHAGNIGMHTQRQLNGAEYYATDIYGVEVRDNQITGIRGVTPVAANEAPEYSGIVSLSGTRASNQGAKIPYNGDTTNILIENNLLKSLDTAITTKKYEYGIVLKGNVFADVGQAKDMTTPENLTERDMNVTKAILDGYISAWEKASSKNYTEESFKALTDALAAAKAISADSNATQTSIALALQELRIASGGLVWVISDSTDPVNPIDPVDPIDPIDPPRPTIPSYIPATSDSKFPFKDVSRSDAFYDAVKYLYENDIMNGTSKTEFSPNAELTRGMVVTILYRMEGEPLTAGAKTFSDVKAGIYYSKAVDWAAEKNIVNGFSDGTFKPEQPVTREQLATIISRYAVSKGIVVYDAANALASTDVVSAWARSNVAWAAAEGILTKTETTNATKTASRAEVATAIYTYLTKTAK